MPRDPRGIFFAFSDIESRHVGRVTLVRRVGSYLAGGIARGEFVWYSDPLLSGRGSNILENLTLSSPAARPPVSDEMRRSIRNRERSLIEQ